MLMQCKRQIRNYLLNVHPTQQGPISLESCMAAAFATSASATTTTQFGTKELKRKSRAHNSNSPSGLCENFSLFLSFPSPPRRLIIRLSQIVICAARGIKPEFKLGFRSVACSLHFVLHRDLIFDDLIMSLFHHAKFHKATPFISFLSNSIQGKKLKE